MLRGFRLITAVLVFASIQGRAIGSEDLVELVKRVKPAVVTVLSYSSEDAAIPRGLGTGFFVAKDRLVTNWHVVRGARKIEFRNSKGEVHLVTAIVAVDKRRDLAVLAPERAVSGTSVLHVNGRSPDVGQAVYVLGSPRGLDYSLSDGLVSSRRKVDGTELLQITAAISPGSSGSPVFQADGTVVGVATFTRTDGQSLNFAIPAACIQPLLRGRGKPVAEFSANEPEPALTEDDVEQLLKTLYDGFAEAYLENARQQQTNRPSMTFGAAKGSVGHLTARVKVFQVISEDSALLEAIDPYGYQNRLFKIDGVDLRNHVDGDHASLGDLVLAQYTTYQYTTVLGAKKTVFAVQALSMDRFRAALRRQLAPVYKKMNQLTERLSEKRSALRGLETDLDRLLKESRDVQRAIELRREIKMYRPAMAKESIRKRVEGLEQQLESLDIGGEQIAGHQTQVKLLEAEIETASRELIAEEASLQAAREQLPSLLKQ